MPGDAYTFDTLGVGWCTVLAVTSTDKCNWHFEFSQGADSPLHVEFVTQDGYIYECYLSKSIYLNLNFQIGHLNLILLFVNF